MACAPEVLRKIPLFSLLDDDELAALAAQVLVERFAARERIYKIGDPSRAAFVMVSGAVRVTTVDEDQQEVIVDEPIRGDLFGFASMINARPHQTNALAIEDTVCIRLGQQDLSVLLQNKPMAGMNMLAVLGRKFHGAQELVRRRAARSPNEIIEEQATAGERIADAVAGFGGSWSFIVSFTIVLVLYAGVNISLGSKAWDPYPFILLNLFLSMLAAIQAPVIMMSQNRQDKKDRVRSEMDFEVNRRAEAEIKNLARSVRLLEDRIEDVGDLLRNEPRRSRPDDGGYSVPVRSG